MTKHTLKDFLDGQFCVRCANQNDKQCLLQFCADNGIGKVWFSTLDIQQVVSMYNVFFVDRNSQALRIIADITSAFCTPVPFSSLVNDTSPRRIVIDYSDTITTATLYNGEKAVKSATINRSQSDEPSLHVAAVEVIDKLLAKQGKHTKETAKPEKPLEKDGFKVGDRVVCVGETSNPAVAGKHGTVMYIDNIDCIGIQFDEYVDGHGLESACLRLAIKHGHGWWCKGENLRHEQPAKPQVREVKRHAKVGEWVKIVGADRGHGEKYASGDVLRVLDVGRAGWAHLSCGGVCTAPEEYVVLEGYQPEEPANA